MAQRIPVYVDGKRNSVGSLPVPEWKFQPAGIGRVNGKYQRQPDKRIVSIRVASLADAKRLPGFKAK